jgi:uncharacterized protein
VFVRELTPEELRVLGSLAEKELTTPQQYPLTLNALTSACNQSSNRDPVVTYAETAVEAAVTAAKTKGLARFVHPSHGRSALRYAHMLQEALELDRRQLALLTVLVLRGPQTAGELRVRTERMEAFSDLADVERELERLAQRSEPLVGRIGRAPGQKEDRFVQLVGDSGPISERPPTDTPSSPSPGEGSLEEALADLRAEVAGLRRELDELRERLAPGEQSSKAIGPP